MKFYKNSKKKVMKSEAGHLPNEIQAINVFPSVEENLGYIRKTLRKGIDLIESRLEFSDSSINAGLIYIESISDKKLISQHVLMPLLDYSGKLDKSPDKVMIFIQTKVISIPGTKITDQMDQVIERILNGDTVLFIENAECALIAGNRKFEKRAIEKPVNEETVFGSQESFTDDLNTNISMIIKRLPVPELHFESYTIGTLSYTKVKLIWLESIANPKIIEEAKWRLEKVHIDNLTGLGILAELIEDKPLSVFPKYRQTERPDTVAKSLSDGRFAIICSNSPFALVAPVSLWDGFATMDDYEDKVLSGNYLRIVRYISFLLSILISPLYLAFVTYNHSIVPTTLAMNIAAGRRGVPFPSVLETLIMTFAMSLIREAGVRMPGAVGYFIGTLAAVLIGQSIVTAGYVSASLIIVIAISVIASFAISSPTLIYTSRLLNYFLLIWAGFFGMFGVINGLIIIYWHLVSLQSFGVPYLYPLVPLEAEGLKDSLIRASYKTLKKRLKLLSPSNQVRVDEKAFNSGQKKTGGE